MKAKQANMRRSSYHTLIDHARKAGLQTSELYAALSGERMTPEDGAGRTDSNGLVADTDIHGHPVFKSEASGRPS